jgi:hypothetical protein
MRSILCGFALLALAADVTSAQSSDMMISVSGFQLTAGGPEKAVGVTRGVSLYPNSFGRPTPAVFSMYGCGGFSVSPAGPFAENAIAGWRLEVTPIKVVETAVTFRLRWVRALDTGSGFSPASEDLELTLRPGEWRPLDSVPIPKGIKSLDGQPCAIKSGSLRVSVEFKAFDRRLIGADVWLVERLRNGKEDSQLQSVRGVPHRDVPFYFDTVSSGAERFDFFGHLTGELGDGGLEIAVEVVRAKADRDQETGYQAARWFRSTIHVKPNETVEVALKAEDTGELAGRMFALRIRAKQIR